MVSKLFINKALGGERIMCNLAKQIKVTRCCLRSVNSGMKQSGGAGDGQVQRSLPAR